MKTLKTLFLGILASFSALSADADAQVTKQVRELNRAQYDQIYPFYVQVCSMSVVERKGMEKGGSPGHSAAYVKGLCRDMSAGYPRVKVCDFSRKYTPQEEELGIGFNDIRNPNAGLGFSANKEFRNVNWVATPGKEIFFHGKLPPTVKLTDQYMDSLANEMVRLKTHQGITIYDEYDTRADKTKEDMTKLVAMRSMDTDYAITFGRHVHCVKVPVKQSMLPLVVTYLNDLNDRYQKGSKDYKWAGLTNSCAHFTHNILSSIGFWGWNVGANNSTEPTLFPTNLGISIARKGTDRSLEDNFKQLWSETATRDNMGRARPGTFEVFNSHQWSPTQPGVLIDIMASHPQENNEKYVINPVDDVWVFPFTMHDGFKWNLKDYAKQISSTPRFVDIEENLKYYQDLYSGFLKPMKQLVAQGKPIMDWTFWKWGNPWTAWNTNFVTIQNQYPTHIVLQTHEVNRKLNQVRQMKRSLP
jgi:hypothetical protein